MRIFIAPLFSSIVVVSAFAQGSLTPPGAPAPVMKTLSQIEPRTPISSLPYTITNPGSYYVTTNLTGISGQNGVTLNASDITLDLSGFELAGVPGSLAGIQAPNEVTNIFIHNGTVRNWGGNGLELNLTHESRVEHVHAQRNGGLGIGLGGGDLVENCSAISNTFTGISAFGVIRNCAAIGNGSDGISGETLQSCMAEGNGGNGVHSSISIVDCSAAYNHRDGILIESGGLISRSAAQFNSGNGIEARFSDLIRDCSAYNNGATGIVAAVSCRIVSCVIEGNTIGISAGQASTVKDCTVRNSSGDGIVVPNDCVVQDNDCVDNGSMGGAGVHVTIAGNRIEGNTTILNSKGIWIEGAANMVVRNISRYNPGSGSIGSSNFVINAGNTVGEILNFSSGGTITNANPWANFSY
ncbi:MAG TPA: right-handed parallel beta-helix repeat-containing protein [Verrucomicrobiae bacterium]|nr:right-handed parallel beta-helix repeat-containing protein [Verrucomicrobiae bacterium]